VLKTIESIRSEGATTTSPGQRPGLMNQDVTLDVLKSMSQSLVKNLVHLVFWSQITALKSVAFGWLEGRRSWMGRCG
jgi:hypothetical protein